MYTNEAERASYKDIYDDFKLLVTMVYTKKYFSALRVNATV